jgi:hypothetical protein
LVATRNSHDDDDGPTGEDEDFNDGFILADASDDQAYSTNTPAIDMDGDVAMDPVGDGLDNVAAATNSAAGM